MTDPRRQRFAPYVRRLADMLAFKDWQVEIADDEPSNPDAYASVEPLAGRKVAVIRLGCRFLDLSPEGQRHTMAHELVHLHVEPFYRIGLNAVPKDVESPFHVAMEYAVDGIADGIAPLLPLPDLEPRS